MEGTSVKKSKLEEMLKTVLIAPNGEKVRLIPLESIESDDGKLYVIYVYAESLKNDSIDVFASRVVEQDGSMALVELESEEEFDLIKSAMASYEFE